MRGIYMMRCFAPLWLYASNHSLWKFKWKWPGDFCCILWSEDTQISGPPGRSQLGIWEVRWHYLRCPEMQRRPDCTSGFQGHRTKWLRLDFLFILHMLRGGVENAGRLLQGQEVWSGRHGREGKGRALVSRQNRTMAAVSHTLGSITETAAGSLRYESHSNVTLVGGVRPRG